MYPRTVALLALTGLVACGDVAQGGAADARVDARSTIHGVPDASLRLEGSAAADVSRVVETGVLPVNVDSGHDALDPDATYLIFQDAAPDAPCGCVYQSLPPHGACAMPGLTCDPADPSSPGGCFTGGCGPQPCTCLDGGWSCEPVPPCKGKPAR